MEITILIDNNKKDIRYRAEHGLSILIEDDITILFDTGKTDAFIENAKILNKDLTKVDYVVLSHGHYDHTGGLEAFLKINKKAKVILKNEALEDKWSMSKGYNKSIGFPLAKRFKQKNQRYIFVEEAFEMNEGAWVIPNITRPDNYKFTDSYLYVKRDGLLNVDSFDDELLLTIKKNNKLIIFTGCAHNGIVNMIQTAINFNNVSDIELVIGGTHLNRASKEQVESAIEGLKKFNIDKAAFNHCSNINNIPYMNEQLNANVTYAYAGDKILLD